MEMAKTNNVIQDKYDSFIFTHIPKCGGTSFRHFINTSGKINKINEDEIYIPGCNGLTADKNLDQLNKTELKQLKKRRIKILANHSKYNEHLQHKLIIQKPYYYTLLRDPVERFISHYNFFYYKNGLDDLSNISLNDLDEGRLEELIIRLSNLQVRYISNVKYPKAVGLENQYKIAHYNLTQIYGNFGILDKMEESIDLLSHSMVES